VVNLLANNTKLLIEKYKIIAIIRGIELERLIPTAEALYKGGVRLMEVTFNQKSSRYIEETSIRIEQLCKYFGEDLCIGAGTVMSIEQVEAAANVGAKYMISPNTDTEVIKRALDFNTVSIPGALTPSEIVLAYKAGASFVKLFPAGELGIKYIKAVCSPINHIPMLAVGGINEYNLRDFLEAGIKGVGIGSNIVKKSLIEEGKYDDLTALALRYTSQI